MGGRRHTKEELQQIQMLVNEGVTSREIAQRLGRTEAAIRNLRHRTQLTTKAEDESKTLLQHRDELREAVNALQQEQKTLTSYVEKLKFENQILRTAVSIDKVLLQRTLTQALTILKEERPDLFALSQADQV